MKKLLALFAASTMMFTVTANALVLVEPYGGKTATSSSWTTTTPSNVQARHTLAVVDGQLQIRRISGTSTSTTVPSNRAYGYIERTWDTELTDGMNIGTYTFSMDFATVGHYDNGGLFNGGSWNGYTVKVLDADDAVIASFRIARNAGNVLLGDQKIASSTKNYTDITAVAGEGVDAEAVWKSLTADEKYNVYSFIEDGATMQMEIVYSENDGEDGVVYLIRNGKKVWNTDFSAPVSAAVPAGVGAPAKVSIENSMGSVQESVLALDNISLHGTMIQEASITEDGYVFNDTFEAEEGKRLITDYGWAAKDFYYYTDDAIGYILPTKNETIPLCRVLAEPVSEGKLVAEFGIHAYNTSGARVHFYSQNTATLASGQGPAFSAIAGTKVASTNTVISSMAEAGTTTRKLNSMNLNGVITTTSVPNQDAAPYRWQDVDCFKVVMDMDNDVTDYYYRTTEDGEWILLNSTPVPFVTKDTAIKALAFYGRHTHYQVEYKYLKAYTVDADGFTTPVIFKDDAPYTENAASDVLKIYSASNITVAEGEDTPYPAIITAVYDELGKFVECKIHELGAVTGTGLYSAPYTLPATATSAYTLKAFVWDGIDLMIPMSDVATVYPVVVEEDPAE